MTSDYDENKGIFNRISRSQCKNICDVKNRKEKDTGFLHKPCN